MASSGGVKDETDSEQDLHLLLECLHFQQNCISSQRQALTTIATMCNNSASLCDLLRTSGGLEYVLDLLYHRPSPELQQAALYTLGCAAERNHVNQVRLCDQKLFSLLADLLSVEEDSPPPILTTAAYLAGCLMSNNSRGQNMAREEKVLHRLIARFKSHLPTHQPSPASSESAEHIELWTSVSSALCTATNNPQNETNQALCSRVFPAALSLLQDRVGVARPAITVITSCIASNTTTQDRLRTVGGLQTLVGSLKVLLTHSTTSNTDYRDLLVHIVKALSAAAFGHATNCDLLCSLDTVHLLLVLLQNKYLDGSAQLIVVMCLGMLTEDSPISQKVFKDGDGLNVLVKCLVGSKDEELSKAVAFVMQCCLGPQSPPPSPSAEDKHISASIARLESMLQPREDSDNGSSSPDTQAAPIASDVTELDAEALKVLDGQKLPANERVSHWLNGSPPAPNQSGVLSMVFAGKEVNLLKDLERIQLLHNLTRANCSEIPTHPVSSSTCIIPIPAAFTSDPMEFQVENLKTAFLAAKTNPVSGGSGCDSHLHNTQGHDCTMGRAEGETLESRLLPTVATQLSPSLKAPASEHVKTHVCCDTKGSKVDTSGVGDKTARELQKERAHREKLERELVEEKHKRLKLEQEAALANNTEHQEPMTQQWNGISQSQKVSSDRGQAGSARTDVVERPQMSGSLRVLTSKSTKGACTSQVVRLPADTSSKVAAHKHQNLSSCHMESKTAKTPGFSKLNTRYANSSKPNTHYADSSNVLQTPRPPRPHTTATLPQRCATPSNHESKITKESEAETITPHSRLFLSQIPISPSSLTYSKVLGTCTKPSSITIPPGTPQTTASRVHLPRCDHQCLGCHPRLKCPLITSRNFVKMLRADHYTCAYHRRLVSRLATCNQMDNLPFAVMKPNQIGQQAGASSTHHTLHTNTKPVSTQTQSRSSITVPLCMGPHGQRSTYQESSLPMESSPPLSAPQVTLATSFPAPHSLTPDQLQQESTYSHDTQNLTRPATSPETSRNLPPPNLKRRHYGSTNSQPTCQHIKPNSNQRSKISNQTHHRQPKTKIQCSSSHSKKLTKGLLARSPPLTNLTNVAHHPISVFDYHITPPDKFKTVNTKIPAMLPPSNRREFSEVKKQARRSRVPFSRQEENNLIAGVRKLDRRWRHILAAYHFHPTRTSVDLKDKYRLLEAKEMV